MGETLQRSPSLSPSKQTEELRDSTFLRNEGVTYVTGCGVVEHPPGSDHWVAGFDSDLLLKGLSN
jgi:hypothetical protein